MKTIEIKNPKIRFIYKLTRLLVLLFLLDLLVGAALQRLYFSQKGGQYADLSHSMLSNNSDVLIFGSSIGVSGYIPDIFSNILGYSCENLSAWAQKMFYAYIKEETVLKNGHKPKIIVFNMDQYMLYENKLENSYDKLSVFLPYYSILGESKFLIHKRSKYEQLKLFSKIYPYNSMVVQSILFNFIKEWKGTKTRGYIALTNEVDPDAKDLQLSRTSVDPIPNQSLGEDSVHSFESFVANAVNAGVKLVVVVPPPYEKFLPFENKSLKKAREILVKYDVPLWDYSNDERFLKHYKIYSDVEHFNDKGARIFSGILAERIKREFKSEVSLRSVK